jgi:hypothetical protein
MAELMRDEPSEKRIEAGINAFYASDVDQRSPFSVRDTVIAVSHAATDQLPDGESSRPGPRRASQAAGSGPAHGFGTGAPGTPALGVPVPPTGF